MWVFLSTVLKNLFFFLEVRDAQNNIADWNGEIPPQNFWERWTRKEDFPQNNPNFFSLKTSQPTQRQDESRANLFISMGCSAHWDWTMIQHLALFSSRSPQRGLWCAGWVLRNCSFQIKWGVHQLILSESPPSDVRWHNSDVRLFGSQEEVMIWI